MDAVIRGTTMPVLEVHLTPGESRCRRGGPARLVRRRHRARDVDRAGGRRRCLGRSEAQFRRWHLLHDAVRVDDAAGHRRVPRAAARQDLPDPARPGPLVRHPAARLPRRARRRELSTAFQPGHVGSAVLGGFGFLLQKLEGVGHAWIELAGEISEYDLAAGQTLRVHPAHVGVIEGSGRLRADDGSRDQEQVLRRRRPLSPAADRARQGLAAVAFAADARACARSRTCRRRATPQTPAQGLETRRHRRGRQGDRRAALVGSPHGGGTASDGARRARASRSSPSAPLDGTWAARLPALKHRLGLDSGQLGLVIFIVSLDGDRCCLPVAGWLASRCGSRGPTAARPPARRGAGLTGAAFAPSFATLVPAACRDRRRLRASSTSQRTRTVSRSSSGSAGRSSPCCTACGASGCSPAPGSRQAPRRRRSRRAWQFPVVAAVCARARRDRSCRGCCRATAADVDSAHFALPRGALALPAFLTFCAHVRRVGDDELERRLPRRARSHASAAVAAGGVVVYAIAMAFARLAGDPLLRRAGASRRLARRSGALTVRRHRARARDAVGRAGAHRASRSSAPGCAAIVPALFRVGGSVPGVSSGAGIAAVATAGYTGARRQRAGDRLSRARHRPDAARCR